MFFGDFYQCPTCKNKLKLPLLSQPEEPMRDQTQGDHHSVAFLRYPRIPCALCLSLFSLNWEIRMKIINTSLLSFINNNCKFVLE